MTTPAAVSPACGVAGVHAPAFVERGPWHRSRRPSPLVSPGFTPRPSLSGHHAAKPRRAPDGVAGVHAPAFVERPDTARAGAAGEWVSPGFTPRPSLSDGRSAAERDPDGLVSPGFTPRPSLSALKPPEGPVVAVGVAGVHAPAFVERGSAAPTTCEHGGGVAGVHAPAFVERGSTAPGAASCSARVAGVHAPAFVERFTGTTDTCRHRRRVSPGFTPRPSLSVDVDERFPHRQRVSPGFTPRPSLSAHVADNPRRRPAARVAGVHAPAFVERAGPGDLTGDLTDGRRAACRRGSRPGLR